MGDPRLEKWARLITEYCVEVRAGDRVFIQTAPAATPLVLEIYREILQRGATAQFLIDLPGIDEIFYTYANEEQLKVEPPLMKKVVEEFDVRIAIRAAENTKELSNVDARNQSLHLAAKQPTFDTFMQRQGRGEMRWVVTQYPTNAYAHDASMSLREYEDFVFSACLLDEGDPVARWKEIGIKQQRLIEWLVGKRRIEVKGPNVDLLIGIEGRTFENSCGKRNMPDGEIFTGPEESVTEGWVKFTYPAIRENREVQGVELEFKGGRVVKAGAEKGEDYLNGIIDTDEGARVLGEFAIGTNLNIQKFMRNTLFDEKIGGTIHMAVGAGYPNTGSKNVSAVHWDMICDTRDGTEIKVDGELFYRNGEFLI